MSNILIFVVLIIAAFVIAILNNKKRREITVERIRVVRGSMDAFDEEAFAWPEDAGEVFELRLYDKFLDDTLTVSMIKPNTIKFASTKPFIIEGQPTKNFELSRIENLVLESMDGDEEPIILSYEKMLNPRMKTQEELRAEAIAKLKREVGQTEDALEEGAETAETELTAAAEELDDLGDAVESKLDDLGDAIEDKVDTVTDAVEDKVEDLADALDDKIDDLKDKIEQKLDDIQDKPE